MQSLMLVLVAVSEELKQTDKHTDRIALYLLNTFSAEILRTDKIRTTSFYKENKLEIIKAKAVLPILQAYPIIVPLFWSKNGFECSSIKRSITVLSLLDKFLDFWRPKNKKIFSIYFTDRHIDDTIILRLLF